jgi:hypothetical protein
MAVKHWIFLILVIIAVLFLWHNYSSHGGTAGLKQGLGVNG